MLQKNKDHIKKIAMMEQDLKKFPLPQKGEMDLFTVPGIYPENKLRKCGIFNLFSSMHQP